MEEIKFVMQSMIITNIKLREHLESILARIESRRMPKEYRVLVASFFEAASELYEHKTWMLRMLIIPLIVFASVLAYASKAARKSRDFLVYQKKRIDEIEQELEANVSRFAV